MLKKVLLVLIIFTGVAAFASDNYLNSIVIDKNDSDISVILRSDVASKIKREVDGSDKIILTLKSTKQSPDVTTLYKNINDVYGVVLQNDNNDLKVFIEAPNISNADIVTETPNSAPITLNNKTNKGKFLWSLISFGLLLLVMLYAKNMTFETKQKDLTEIIKEREKALYRNFQKEVSTLPSINYKLKGYRKHVLNGETIRSYESRMSRI